jgi:hypothetical protein
VTGLAGVARHSTDDDSPPTSAGRGGNGTAELAAVEGAGAEVDGEAAAEVLGLAVAGAVAGDVAVDGDADPEDGVDDEDAGALGPWKSLQVSVRNVSPLAVTLNAVAVMVYFTPSLLTTKVLVDVCLAGAISLAPSLTRTPRYSKEPSADSQMATREDWVVPKSTAVSGLEHRAVELT